MYIVYSRNQKQIRDTLQLEDFKSGIDRLRVSKVSDFKPACLVRISDMQVVRGSTIKDPYWALSYSWNQSGNVVDKGNEEYERADEGKHMILSRHKLLWWTCRKKVKFERLIRQICKDAKIKYIWYDQMCINQNNHDDKVREIRQMHLIYKHALCTLVLVPELKATCKDSRYYGELVNMDEILDSQWSRRIWTLQEAYMSEQILLLGRDVHIWSNKIKTNSDGKFATFIKNFRDSKKDKWRACTALWYARTRVSSNAHDRIFALVNMFPELKDHITFSYQQPVLDLMNQFYILLAQNDPSILVFGSPITMDVDGKKSLSSPEETTGVLPSWTGAHGVHVPQSYFFNGRADGSFFCTIIGECMSLTSEYVSASIKAPESLEQSEYLEHQYRYTKNILPDQEVFISESRQLVFVNATSEFQNASIYRTVHSGLKATHFLPLKEDGQATVDTAPSPTLAVGFLSLTDDASECIILTGLSFSIKYQRCHPVIKKEGKHYKSIGLCLVDEKLFLNSMVQPEQTFLIL